MGVLEIFTISVGLAMDTFAVSICKGLSMRKMCWKNGIVIACYFGIFQGLMPMIGYFLGTTFSGLVESIDHWIVFLLLATIGYKMIKDSRNNDNEDRNERVDMKTMLVLAIATSIDALAVGITFSFFEISIADCAMTIGAITFVLSLIGVFIGNKFGDKFQNKAELLGGITLILIGIKILLEHLMG